MTPWRRGHTLESLVHHSNAGCHYVSTRCSDRPAASIAPSVASPGDAYDSSLAESIVGPYKT